MNYDSFIGKVISALACASVILAGCSKNNEPEKPEEPAHFTMSVSDETSSTCMYSIKRDDASKSFYSAIVDVESLETLGDDFQAQAAAYMSGELDFLESTFGMTHDEAVASVISTEDVENEFREYLSAATDYVLMAAYVNADGTVDGAFEKLTFRTQDVEPSSNTFEVKVSEVQARFASVSVTPSNTDPYTVIVTPYADVEGMSDDQLIENFISSYGIFLSIYNGETEINPDIKAGTRYLVAVFGVDSEKATTALTKTEFTTPAGGKPEDWRFDVSWSEGDVKGYKVDVSIIPNDGSIDYCFELVDARYTASQFKSEYEQNVVKTIEGSGMSVQDYYLVFSSHGEAGNSYTVMPGVKYKVAGFAVDVTEGRIAGDIMFSDEFLIENPGQSEAEMQVTWDKYYDGDAIAKLNEEYSSFAGLAVFPVTIATKPENLSYYYGVYVYDGSDAYTRDQIISAVISDGTSYPADCFVPWNRDAVIYGVAVDENGVCGPVFEKVFKMTKDGVSPAEDYFAGQQQFMVPAPVKPQPSAHTPFGIAPLLRATR